MLMSAERNMLCWDGAMVAAMGGPSAVWLFDDDGGEPQMQMQADQGLVSSSRVR